VTSADERQKAIPYDELFIDIGLPEEKAKELVAVGDLVTVKRQFTELSGSVVSGKGFDDRAGVTVLYTVLKLLQGIRHQADVYAVATVQEESGLRGAIVSTYQLMPDLGIAVDVGFGDFPGQPESRTINLGKGPGITLGGNVHPYIHEQLKKTAQTHRIPYQVEIAPGNSGTDAWAMQVTRSGVPTGLLSIPLRYMHTSVETVDTKDIEDTGRLLAHFIANIDQAWMEGLRYAAGETK
jgi:endoglucanase